MAERQDKQRVVELRRWDGRDDAEDVARAVFARLREDRIARLTLGQDGVGVGALDRLDEPLAGGQRLVGRLADRGDLVAIVVALAGRATGHELVRLAADRGRVIQLLELALALLLEEELMGQRAH